MCIFSALRDASVFAARNVSFVFLVPDADTDAEDEPGGGVAAHGDGERVEFMWHRECPAV
jgi:hypothetical protein